MPPRREGNDSIPEDQEVMRSLHSNSEPAEEVAETIQHVAPGENPFAEEDAEAGQDDDASSSLGPVRKFCPDCGILLSQELTCRTLVMIVNGLDAHRASAATANAAPVKGNTRSFVRSVCISSWVLIAKPA